MNILVVDESNVLKNIFNQRVDGKMVYGIDAIYENKAINIINKVCLDNRAHLIIINHWSKYTDEKLTKIKLKEKGIKVPIIGFIDCSYNEMNRIELIKEYISSLKMKFESNIKWASLLDSVYTKDVTNKMILIPKVHSTEKNVVLIPMNGLNENLNKLIEPVFIQ